jgi:predicted phosphodiesterase
MLAVLSDIHSNLEALKAVLADADRQGAKEVFCLGDIVGYGPNPVQCIDIALSFQVVILGNHDHAAVFDPAGFNRMAECAIFWTREQLESAPDSWERKDERWSFLAERPQSHRDAHRLFVHGSARIPLSEYVFPDDICDRRKMERIFARVERYCFQGHTHVPGIFTEDLRFLSPEEIGSRYQLDSCKTLCNVGSVGQPRDGDWRACYVLLDGDTVHFRRVEYDVDETVRKIHALPQLDPVLGNRLRDGR